MNPRTPSRPPCEFLPVLQWQLSQLAEDLNQFGGFRPERLQSWNEFFDASQDHLNRCSVCQEHFLSFVDWVEKHPVPVPPKPKNVIWEIFTDILVGTIFNVMAPKIARDIGKMFTGDDKKR